MTKLTQLYVRIAEKHTSASTLIDLINPYRPHLELVEFSDSHGTNSHDSGQTKWIFVGYKYMFVLRLMALH